MGFLSLHYGWRGPTFTVSQENESTWGALILADTLLSSGFKDVLVVAADEKTPHFNAGFDLIYSQDQPYETRAACVWLTTKEAPWNLALNEGATSTISEVTQISSYNDSDLLRMMAMSCEQFKMDASQHSFSCPLLGKSYYGKWLGGHSQ